MIINCHGDIFKSRAQALVNPVNCIGISGAGLAKEFKIRYTKNYNNYKNYCLMEKLKPGKIFVYDTGKKLIINAATKNHFKEDSKYSYIHSCLKEICYLIDLGKFNSIAIPALGCGLGNLEWIKVKKMMISMFSLYEKYIDFEIYNPVRKKWIQ